MAAIRKRKPHPKTRNGCQICKDRHVKCDQSWPCCEQCSSTGRQCDGYDSRLGTLFTPRHMSVKYFRETFCPTPLPPLRRFGDRSTEEMRSLDYFQACTVSALSSFFDTGVWECLPLSIGQIEPAVLHAIIALSTYHEISERVGPGDCWDIQRSNSSDPVFRFAAEHYAAAISSFRNSLSSKDLSAPGVEMICILLACVEFLRGYRESALVHISGALGFVKSRQQKFLQSREDSEETALKSLLARMSITQSLYGRPRGIHCPELLDLHKEPPNLQEGKFCSVNEARMASTSLMNSTFRFVRMVLGDHFQDAFAALAAQLSLERQLQNWSVAFEAFVKDSATCTKDPRGPCLLRIHHLIATIFVAASATKRESTFDLHISKFEAIIESVEVILSHERNGGSLNSSSFSLDRGIIPPLFYTAIKCRFPAVRRRAIALLRRAPRKEGLWDTIESAKVAELAMDFEEQQVMDGVFSHGQLPECVRLHDVDILGKDHSDPSKQLVILRWKPNGIDKQMQEVRTYIQW